MERKGVRSSGAPVRGRAACTMSARGRIAGPYFSPVLGAHPARDVCAQMEAALRQPRGAVTPACQTLRFLASTLHRHLVERKGRVRMIDLRMKIEETR